MLKKILIAAATGAALMGSVAPSYADYVRSDGTVVRTHSHRVVVERPYHRHYANRGYHRVWHHGRMHWERNRY